MSSTTATANTANTFKGFWMTHHNLRRHPFAAPGTPAKTTGEMRATTGKTFWSDLKGFFKTYHNLRRHPFDIKV